MAHHIISSAFPTPQDPINPTDLARVIAEKMSRDNFSIFDVMTGKMVRSGFAFALDADPVYKAKNFGVAEVSIALGLGRRDGAVHMAMYPRFDSFFDFLSVAVTKRREEAIEATFASGFSAYFDATTRRTTTVRHNFADG